MQTITKLGVSILLVVIMLIFSFYEESVFMSVLLGTPARVLSSLAFTAIVCVILACGMGESFLLRLTRRVGSVHVGVPAMDDHHSRHLLPSAGPGRGQHGSHHHHVLPRGQDAPARKAALFVAVGACAFSDS